MLESVDTAIAKALQRLDSNFVEEAWMVLQPHRQQLGSNENLAEAWIRVAAAGVPLDEWRDSALDLGEAYAHDWRLLNSLSGLLESAAEQRPMDEPDEEGGLADLSAEFARGALAAYQGKDGSTLAGLYGNLGNALRLAGPSFDEEAEEHLRRAIELEPDPTEQLHDWFNLGLLFKWRGRWQEGLEANQKRLALEDDDEGALWNAGICATGLGEGWMAHEFWTRLGVKETIGEDGLPLGRFKDAQVRLSSLGPGIDPHAHEPGCVPIFENVWVERLSPCHGRIRNATVRNMPADFDDLVLWDGAPVDYRIDGEERVARFPLLSVLRPSRALCWRFVASQTAPRFWSELEALPPRAFFYVHSESVVWQCAECAKGDQSHAHDSLPFCEVVSGKLIAPKELAVDELAACLRAICASNGVELAVPELFPEGSAERRDAESAMARLSKRLKAPAC